jgi:cytochrome d ubiquinol oxidase subunit I
MTTAQAASKVPTGMIATTLVMYLALYLALIAAYISVVFLMARKAGQYEAPLSENPAQTSPYVVNP